MRVYSQPDIVGASSTQNLATVAGVAAGQFVYARSILFTSTGGSGGARVGDNPDSSHGVEIPAAGLVLPFNPVDPSSPGAGYDLAQTNVYVPSGVTVQWSYIG